MLDAGGGAAGFIASAKATAKAAGKNEDIAFTAEGVDRVIKRLEEIVDMKLGRAGRELQRGVNVSDPEDYVSASFVSDVNRFKDNAGKFDEEYVKEIETLIENLKEVKHAYLEREDDIGQSFSQQGLSV